MKKERSIVIIDDEEDVLNPLAEMIQRKFKEINKDSSNYNGRSTEFVIEIKKYSNAGLAHLGFGKKLIDLAIFDLDLKGENGLNIVKNIRNAILNNNEPFGDPYILIYSANLLNTGYNSQILEIEKKYARKFHGFINKPNETALVERVVELITKGQAGSLQS